MKQNNKQLRITYVIMFLVFALMCISNVTYSYFTATSSAEGSLNFENINVEFQYVLNGESTKIEKNDTLEVAPIEGTIDRGVPFTFAIEDSGTYKAIDGLIIKNSGCEVYVRFWVDAYLKSDTEHTGINYGKYFFFESSIGYTNEDGVDKSGNKISNCYYVTSKMDTSYFAMCGIGNTLTLSDIYKYDYESGEEELVAEIPMDIFGEELEIFISFEAVQAANKAFESVFNDERGYYKDWS